MEVFIRIPASPVCVNRARRERYAWLKETYGASRPDLDRSTNCLQVDHATESNHSNSSNEVSGSYLASRITQIGDAHSTEARRCPSSSKVAGLFISEMTEGSTLRAPYRRHGGLLSYPRSS